MSKAPIRVCVTGAAGQIAYSLIPMIAQGEMLGKDQPIILSLLDIPFCQTVLGGVVMELEDASYPLLKEVIPTTDPAVAFKDVDIAILVGAFPRKDGMERKDLLAKNIGIFKEQGQAINQFASRNVKVLVVGNPANTNAVICKHFAPSIPAKNFSALTRLDHNRAKGQIAKTLSIGAEDVHNVIIWGNHSSTQYPDVNHGYVVKDGAKVPIRQAVADEEFLNGPFIKTVQQRGAAVIAARKLSSAASAAKAIVDHIHDWIIGTPAGEIVSMAVLSDGAHYGIAEGVIYSYPVTCNAGEWTIVEGLEISDFSRQKLDATYAELAEERHTALELLAEH